METICLSVGRVLQYRPCAWDALIHVCVNKCGKCGKFTILNRYEVSNMYKVKGSHMSGHFMNIVEGE